MEKKIKLKTIGGHRIILLGPALVLAMVFFTLDFVTGNSIYKIIGGILFIGPIVLYIIDLFLPKSDGSLVGDVVEVREMGRSNFLIVKDFNNEYYSISISKDEVNVKELVKGDHVAIKYKLTRIFGSTVVYFVGTVNRR